MIFIRILFKSLFLVLYVYLLYKITGKYTFKSLNLIDLFSFLLICFFTIYNIVNDYSVILAIICIGLVFFIKFIISLFEIENSYNYNTKIISNGKILFKSFIKSNYDLCSLYKDIKNKDVRIKDIKDATLDRYGNLICNNSLKNDSIIPLVVDGVIDYNSLDLIDKSDEWLIKRINTNISNVSIAFLKNNTIFVVPINNLKS